mmetsp:Transcript_19850/g.29505  ORF Transcript_19850/g.29505 Transcript_19850/m.29505 type:complete len:207 (+) Transcript_19850:608-1228(+)
MSGNSRAPIGLAGDPSDSVASSSISSTTGRLLFMSENFGNGPPDLLVAMLENAGAMSSSSSAFSIPRESASDASNLTNFFISSSSSIFFGFSTLSTVSIFSSDWMFVESEGTDDSVAGSDGATMGFFLFLRLRSPPPAPFLVAIFSGVTCLPPSTLGIKAGFVEMEKASALKHNMDKTRSMENGLLIMSGNSLSFRLFKIMLANNS